MSTSFAIKTQSLNFGSSFKTNFYHYSSIDNIKMKDAEICFVNLLLEIYDENTSKIIFIDDVNLPTIKEKVQKFYDDAKRLEKFFENRFTLVFNEECIEFVFSDQFTHNTYIDRAKSFIDNLICSNLELEKAILEKCNNKQELVTQSLDALVIFDYYMSLALSKHFEKPEIFDIFITASDLDDKKIQFIFEEVEQNKNSNFFVMFLQELTETTVFKLNIKLNPLEFVVLSNKNFTTGIIIHMSHVNKIENIQFSSCQVDQTELTNGLYAILLYDILFTSISLSSNTMMGAKSDISKINAFGEFIKDYPCFICGGDFNYLQSIQENLPIVEICFPNQEEHAKSNISDTSNKYTFFQMDLEKAGNFKSDSKSTDHLLFKFFGGTKIDCKSYIGPIMRNTSLKCDQIVAQPDYLINSHHISFPVGDAISLLPDLSNHPYNRFMTSMEINIIMDESSKMTEFFKFICPIELTIWKHMSLDTIFEHELNDKCDQDF
jgi:hypothetical protein